MMEHKARADMDNVRSRDTLRRTLATRGVTALENFLGDGLNALEVVLVPDDGRQALSILAYSMDTPCEIALSGFRTEGGRRIDCASAETLRPETQEQATAAIQTFWEGRDAFTQSFQGGRYDLS